MVHTRSYDDDTTRWRAYQPYFPEALRVRRGAMPTEEWWAHDGVDVHLDRLDAPDARAKILVLHGAGAYGRVMSPVALLAQRHGYATVAPDLPGYGLSDVPWSKMTYDRWVDCVCALVEREVARDGLPIALFGVSLGGLLAYHVAARSARVQAVIATTLADPRERSTRAGFARTPWLGTFGLSMLERLRVVLDDVPLPMAYLSRMDAISNDASLSRLCMSDRHGGGNWVPGRFVRTMMGYTPALEPEEFHRCPVLLAHPGEDRMTDISLSRRFFDRLATRDKSMVVLDGAGHMPIEPVGIQQLERASLRFLDAQFPRRDANTPELRA